MIQLSYEFMTLNMLHMQVRKIQLRNQNFYKNSSIPKTHLP